MADAPVPLHRRRLATLRTAIGERLLERGSVAARTDTLPVSQQEWCDAATQAGEELHRPVRTGLGRGGSVVWAVITDWPRTVAELRRAGRQLAERHRRAEEAGPAGRRAERDAGGRRDEDRTG